MGVVMGGRDGSLLSCEYSAIQVQKRVIEILAARITGCCESFDLSAGD